MKIWENVNNVAEKMLSYANSENFDEKQRDDIRHEYAHAMATHIHRRAKLGHGPEWEECCKIVGCKAEQYAQCSEAQKAAIKARESKTQGYILRCKSCGHEWKYKKMGKVLKGVQSGVKYTCPHCGHSDFEILR